MVLHTPILCGDESNLLCAAISNYTYDKGDERTSITDSQSGTTSLTYSAGLLAAETYQSTTTQLLVRFAHDAAGELTGVSRYSDLGGTTPVGSTGYSYDGGRVMSIVHVKGFP